MTMNHGLSAGQRAHLDDALAKLDPRAIAYLFDRLPGALATAELPALTVAPVTDDGETYDALVCPYCGGSVEPVAVDLSVRWTYPDDVVTDHEEVVYTYDETADYDGAAYMHEGCGYVSLPDGWTESN